MHRPIGHSILITARNDDGGGVFFSIPSQSDSGRALHSRLCHWMPFLYCSQQAENVLVSLERGELFVSVSDGHFATFPF